MSDRPAPNIGGRPDASPPRGRELSLLPEHFAICQLAPDALVPGWVTASRSFVTVSRTPTELSIVAEETAVPNEVASDRGYRCLRVEGPLPLDMVGVMAALAAPLAAARVPIFPIATYDHDYLFVPGSVLSTATRALEDAGHRVT